ncbi:D-beta-hydroxybutyrate dehydrogenase, mitochondrial-like isoform X1 [Mizuhopecten yessoensis]|uniref:D-beta-hydroxybutyrate dehydrogenase, mitochondrial-like isoform X1 n=2 Tax=Mizuhopecten yessoensis TaxID=6573 RepID=UPI000B459558|nr:D-beta-hydroxybutyrate dehydrogenase, mitochondrial-like isoform X1 [Mizuhopecten yessoensis]
MAHFHTEFLLFIGYCLLNVYVLVTYWKWSLGLVLLYLGYRLTRMKSRLTIAGKAVLITGCDTGFGHHIAKRLDDRGFTVYAGVLNENSDGAEALRSRKSQNLHVIKLDVTKEEDVNKSLEYVTNNNKADLWAVVNNAGINMPGDVELATVDQYKKCAEVNLYGPIRVIRAFLPLIRRSKGRIVNVSSVRGRFSWPSDSMYHVTKHGLETLSDSLRMEMKKFGVKVVIVEPGNFVDATAISGREMMKRIQREVDFMWDHASEDVKETYGRHYLHRKLKCSFENDGKLSMSPVSDAIEDAIIAENPNIRYLVPGYFLDIYAMIARVYCFLPSWLTDIIVDRLTGYSSFPNQN